MKKVSLLAGNPNLGMLYIGISVQVLLSKYCFLLYI